MKRIFPLGWHLFILVACLICWVAKLAASLIEKTVQDPLASKVSVRNAKCNAVDVASSAERAAARYRALATSLPEVRGTKLMRLSDDMASVARRMNALSVNA